MVQGEEGENDEDESDVAEMKTDFLNDRLGHIS